MLARVIDVAVFVGSRLPASVTHTGAVIGGNAEWALRPNKRRMLAVNLGHAVGANPRSPRVRRLVRREIVNEARRSADLLWAIGRPAELFDRTVVEGTEHVLGVLAGGRGVVLTSLHIGGWEVATSIPARIFPTTVSVIVADNWLAWAMEHIRTAVGLHTLSHNSPLTAAVRRLRAGEALLVLGEDATGPAPRMHTVRFCDGAARLPAGVVALSRIGQAPIAPFSVLPLGPRRWRIVIESPIEPPDPRGGDDAEAATLQVIADRWTALIRANAQHWSAVFPIAWQSP